MKNIIREWLGIEDIDRRLISLNVDIHSLRLMIEDIKNNDLKINTGNPVKENSLTELVYGIANYLEIRPEVTFKEVPKEVQETKIIREFNIVKENPSPQS